MEIKAKAGNDYEAIKTFERVALFKKHDPKKSMIGILILYVVGALLWIRAAYINDNWALLLVPLILTLVYASLTYHYFFIPKIHYKSVNDLGDIDGTIFFTDTEIKEETISEKLNDSIVIGYSVVEKVLETEKYLFIFQNKMQAFIVVKSTIEGGTIDDLREKFTSLLGKKYIVCNF